MSALPVLFSRFYLVTFFLPEFWLLKLVSYELNFACTICKIYQSMFSHLKLLKGTQRTGTGNTEIVLPVNGTGVCFSSGNFEIKTSSKWDRLDRWFSSVNSRTKAMLAVACYAACSKLRDCHVNTFTVVLLDQFTSALPPSVGTSCSFNSDQGGAACSVVHSFCQNSDTK